MPKLKKLTVPIDVTTESHLKDLCNFYGENRYQIINRLIKDTHYRLGLDDIKKCST